MKPCFAKSKRNFRIPEGPVHFLKAPRMFLMLLFTLCTLYSTAQQRTITGKVTAADGTTPLSGVSVQVKGGTAGTQTNVSGVYTLQVPANAT